MLVARIDKEIADVTRQVVDMSWWLDVGETLTSIVSADISLGTSGWSEAPYPPPGAPPPYDPTPLLFETAVIDDSNTQLIVYVAYGTPGNAYTCTFVLLGQSQRQVTVELGVQVKGAPPPPMQSVPLPLPPAPGAGYALPLAGGTLQGPLYLYEDPRYPTEAATRNYVDLAVHPVATLAARIAALEQALDALTTVVNQTKGSAG